MRAWRNFTCLSFASVSSMRAWLSKERKKIREGKLTQSQIRHLESLPNWFWSREDEWNKIYNELLVFLSSLQNREKKLHRLFDSRFGPPEPAYRWNLK